MRERPAGLVVLLLVTAAASAAACSIDMPTAPSTSSPTSADLCPSTTPRAITPAFGQGDGLADKKLALTFDDGPSEVTSELSAYLESEGVKATFFVNGAYIAGREDVLRQVVADGHLVGNHTQTHAALTTLSPAGVVEEVSLTDALIAEYVSPEKLFFRPPFGDWSDEVSQALSKSAMNKYSGPIGWDIGDHLGPNTAADWDCWDENNGTRTVAECGALYLEETEAKGRGIVLLHDGPPEGNGAKTLAMVRDIVPKLKAAGYTFARVDEAFAVGATGGSPSGTSSGAGSGEAAADPCQRR
jgi:peptidoglycan/xylan/chitin deacetylase (PgdA/CDA1 family)